MAMEEIGAVVAKAIAAKDVEVKDDVQGDLFDGQALETKDAEPVIDEKTGEVDVVIDESAEVENPRAILEPKKKDPKNSQDNIDENHPRYKQVWARMKHAEDRVSAIEKNALDDSPVVQQMRVDNKALADKLQAILDQQVDQSVQVAADKDSANIADELDGLETQYDAAMEELDHKGARHIMDKIYDIKLQKALKAQEPVKEDVEIKETPSPIPANAALVEATNLFIDNTPWAQVAGEHYDEAMFSYAQNLDAMMEHAPDWKGKSLIDRFDEVGRLTEVKFGLVEDSSADTDGNARDRLPAVEAGNTTGTGKTTVRLSREERATADAFNMSYAEYAKQRQLGNERRYYANQRR